MVPMHAQSERRLPMNLVAQARKGPPLPRLRLTSARQANPLLHPPPRCFGTAMRRRGSAILAVARPRSARAFSLLELLVVVVIMVMLTTRYWGSGSSTKHKKAQADCQNN